MKSASVTALKNGLSGYLKTVAVGEPVLVTDHRQPVAILRRIEASQADERLSALVAAGVVAPPGRKLSLAAFLKLPKGKSSKSLSAAVEEDRDGR